MIYLFDGILYSNENEWSTATLNMDWSHKIKVWQKELDSVYVLHVQKQLKVVYAIRYQNIYYLR